MARLALAAALALSAGGAQAEDAVARGEYLFAAGGCHTCHTDEKEGVARGAGGPALATPFGTFYGPNITPDTEHGLGQWQEDDFIRAMRQGRGPDGAHYYPAFPYPAYTRITDRDLRDLWAYLRSLEPADRPDRPHELGFPFTLRWLNWGWKLLFFREGRFAPDPERSESWNRGAYLVEALGHCGECHTPRNILGAPRSGLHFAGTAEGPDNELVPNITPDPETGIGNWSEDDIALYLEIGMSPDGDFAGSLMADVIEHGTGRLTADDRAAIAEYLRSLPPISRRVAR